MNNDAGSRDFPRALLYINRPLVISFPINELLQHWAYRENYVIPKRACKDIYFPLETRARKRMRQLRIIERRAFERRGRPMIDRGLKQIAVAKATPVLDGPLPVSTPLVECGPCHTRRPCPCPRPPLTVSRLRIGSDRIGSERNERAFAHTCARARSHTLGSAVSNALQPATDWKDDEPARRCARERTSGKMERGEIR